MMKFEKGRRKERRPSKQAYKLIKQVRIKEERMDGSKERNKERNKGR